MSEVKSGASSAPIKQEEKKAVSIDVAKVEVKKYLDYKRFSDSKIEGLKEQIEVVENGVADGILTIDSEMNIKHQLAIPLKNSSGEETVKSISYKPRLNDKEIKAQMKGAKPSDADERVTRIICALTKLPPKVIDELDTVDSSISKAICMFFL